MRSNFTPKRLGAEVPAAERQRRDERGDEYEAEHRSATASKASSIEFWKAGDRGALVEHQSPVEAEAATHLLGHRTDQA
jgi:hypothetical protein